ncbi:unnamed protein product (macronuclear) [Paramecium tetraurelia]|uniref:Uncharacterized protein n=1 Tax=Paramecium tetraurelia TaxID=5888 RepID=A0CM92_PARTE|nr:uncharacterized protein GSPATT00008388001 [Paramecium tetraurelia]CAK71909.1 unnamed protein product [Paramecium tetraurelia]|eukprot:XP_001439306.1 hypothetical protein (macronuclear) [Paramecium tetraurelia strain d4-2]
MDLLQGRFQNENSDGDSLRQSWTTEDSLSRTSSYDAAEEVNDLEERICQYLNDLNIQSFTNPTLKQEMYNLSLKQLLFSKMISLSNTNSSSLMKKRSLHFAD